MKSLNKLVLIAITIYIVAVPIENNQPATEQQHADEQQRDSTLPATEQQGKKITCVT